MDIKVNCIYHKHWYEPVSNGNIIPKHIQIDRCTLGFQVIENCTECTSCTPHGPRN